MLDSNTHKMKGFLSVRVSHLLRAAGIVAGSKLMRNKLIGKVHRRLRMDALGPVGEFCSGERRG